jgi:hypothetical protein
VSAKGLGLHEDRVRVTCHLPLNNSKEEKAVHRILSYLQQQRNRPIGVKGFSHSEFRPSVFRGYWWSSRRKCWVEDKIVLLIVDYRLSFGAAELSQTVRDLKKSIRDCYRKCGSPQDEVWVVAQQVIRQD